MAIATVVVEVFETVRWLHGSDPDQEELASLYRVLAEAYAHRSRMAARSVAGERRRLAGLVAQDEEPGWGNGD